MNYGIESTLTFLQDAIVVTTKTVGCKLPSIIFLKDKTKALAVRIGKVLRGEVRLIVAGVGGINWSIDFWHLYYSYNRGCSHYRNYTNLAQEIVYSRK